MLFGIKKVTLDIPTQIISADNLHHGKSEMISHKEYIFAFFISGNNKANFSQPIQLDHQGLGLYRAIVGTWDIGSWLQGPSPLPLGILGSRKLFCRYIDRSVIFDLRNIAISFFLGNLYYRWIQISAIKEHTDTENSKSS